MNLRLCSLAGASALFLLGSSVAAESAAPSESAAPPANTAAPPANAVAPSESTAPFVFRVVAPEGEEPSQPEVRSKGMWLAGMITGGIGFGAMVVGGALVIAGKTQDPNCKRDGQPCGSIAMTGGLLAVGIGVVMTTVGVTLGVVGGAPKKKDAAVWIPSHISIGAGSAALQFSF